MRRILDNNTMENGFFSDNCKLDEKLRYNGLYTDLCGMSVEDYIKAGKFPCCDGSQDGGNNDEEVIPTKVINLLTFSTNSNGLLMAYLNYAPTTTINVNCNCEGTNVVFTLTDGNIQVSNVMPTNDVLSVTDVTFEPTEDDKYKYGDYTVVNESNDNSSIVYSTKNMLNFNEIGTIKNLTSDNFNSTTLIDGSTVISFSRNADTNLPEGFDEYTDEEYEIWRKENSYFPLLLVNKNKFLNGEINIYMGNDKLTEDFVEIETLTIDGVTYSALVHTSSNESDQYLTYNNINIFTYSSDADTNLEYIIK